MSLYSSVPSPTPPKTDNPNRYFVATFGGGGKYMAGTGASLTPSCSSSSTCILALSDAGLSRPPLESGLCSVEVGLLGAFGVLKWFRSGKSFVPPNLLNACVRGVMGLNAGLLIPPVVPGVRGAGVFRSNAVLGHW
jgi:hypothetical protein